MRLLLDEHYSPEIARQLRKQGHDVVSVKERAELIGLPDEELLRRMGQEKRAVLTNDVADFTIVLRRLAAAGEEHYGVLFTSDRALPRSKRTIGRFVQILGGLLREGPDEGAYRNRVAWLP